VAQQRGNLMTVRFSNKGMAEIDTLVHEFGLPRAVVIRVMCSVALQNQRALKERLKQVSSESGL